MNRAIDFAIIGAQKAGTTALYEYLGAHQDVFVPAVKEVPYFVKDDVYEKGEKYLDVIYREYRGEPIVGIAHVRLMCRPESVDRLLAHNSAMRCIAVLRDPVTRAYSSYWYARRG